MSNFYLFLLKKIWHSYFTKKIWHLLNQLPEMDSINFTIS